MPVSPGTEEITPGVFGVADSRPVPPPPVIAPPPVLAFAKTMEAPAAALKNEAAANPPIITAKMKSAPPPVAEKASFEMRLGTYWLVRAGIVMLLTGLAFFANYAYHHVVPKLGPGGKISLLYLASGLLLGAGAWWQRRNAKESLKNYAQVLFAGGLAAVYFTTYAAHHIPPLRIIESALLEGALLLAWAGVIAWIADRRKSEVMALFAVGLAFYSSVITRVGDFTLYSNLILTIAAVIFLIRNRWVSLSFAGLATSYAGYAFWRFLHEDGWHWATPDEQLYFGAIFLAAYWLVFTVATFMSRCEKLTGPNCKSTPAASGNFHLVMARRCWLWHCWPKNFCQPNRSPKMPISRKGCCSSRLASSPNSRGSNSRWCSAWKAWCFISSARNDRVSS
jgi:uncharacterized membrane protein